MQQNKAASIVLLKQEELLQSLKITNSQGYTMQDVLENTDPAFMDALQ
jgi:NAD/NADP transhydrogenase alpha subunit